MKKISQKKKTAKVYNDVYNSLYASLCVFANKYLNNLEKSKDVVQDVFIRLWNHEVLSQDEEAIKAFLYVAVRNKSLDYLKSKEHKVNVSSESIDISVLESHMYFEKEVLIEEVSREVDKALKTLPDKCREVVELSMRGYQNNQISEELDISIHTVKTQKKIAYRKLRFLLKGSYAFLWIVINS